ncbi:MAG: M23 family metallopeptidase [Pseudomonadota bacterium]
MIAAGPTSCSRVRTVSIRSVVLGGALAAFGMLAGGVGLGCWISTSTPTAPIAPTAHAGPAHPHSASVFVVEQLGALSGRLFRLESQAGQLGERVGAKLMSPAPKPQASARDSGRGGPLLPARPAQAAVDDLGAIESRLVEIERQIALVSDAAALQNLALMRLPSHLPVAGAHLGSSFGNRDDPFTGRRAFHAGLDFSAGHGTAIRAAAGGSVVFAGFKPDFGWLVEIEHGNGLTTRYAHASRLRVRAGALVTPGDVIAEVGSTGRSTGPHLHFEVLRNGEATDPRRYLAGL